MNVEQDINPSTGKKAPGATTDPNRAAQTAAAYEQRHERGA